MEWCSVLWILFLFRLFSQNVNGARILECDNTGTMEVNEHSQLRVSCQKSYPYSYLRDAGLVKWAVSKGSNVTDIGECTTNLMRQALAPYLNCNSPFSPDIVVDGVGSSQSNLNIKNITREEYSGTAIICNETLVDDGRRIVQDHFALCRLHITISAEVADCTLDVQRQNWTVVGSCDVTKMYSSEEQYSCRPEIQWNMASAWVTDQSATVTFTPTPFTDSKTNRLYYRGRCSFFSPLQPARLGNMTYSVFVSPGNTRAHIGDVMLIAPRSGPTNVNCGIQGFLAENGTSSPVPDRCLCSVVSLGSPPGRLVWFAGDTILLAGDYGVRSLEFPYCSVDRRHEGATMNCQLDWVSISSRTAFTASVAYGPDKAVIQYARHFLATGSDTMTFNCTASGIHPMQYDVQWGGLCLGQMSHTCTLTPKGPKDDGKEVTCSITNMLNNGHSERAKVLLDLIYPPTEPPVITGYTNQPLFDGDTLELTCSVKGGKPPVIFVSMSCQGIASPNNGITQLGQQTTITVDVTPHDHGSLCECTALWEAEDLYHMFSSITLLVFNGSRIHSSHVYSAGRSEGIGIGVGVMVAILVVATVVVVLMVQWRRGRLPLCLMCEPRYDVPNLGKTREAEEHNYTDLSTYETVVKSTKTSDSAKTQSTSVNPKSKSKQTENIYANSGFQSSV